MEIGVGLDGTLGMSWADQLDLSREAAELGYTSIWTPEGTGRDSFQLCVQRWMASREIIPEGIETGIAVSSAMYRTPLSFAMAGGTVSEITGGRFIMGIGTGGAFSPMYRRTVGMGRLSALALMRDYITVIRRLLAEDVVRYEGETLVLRDISIGPTANVATGAISPPPRTPVYLGALGPKMLELSGELADGAALNWCTPDQIAWSRERIDAGAARAGRKPSEIKMAEYIRICVDDDIDVARSALAKATAGYALGAEVPTDRERLYGYRAHFERMGFTEELAELDLMRVKGASEDEVAAAFPDHILQAVGYFGASDAAAAAFKRLAQGLDTAIVRVVPARPGLESVRAVMRACAPATVAAA